jgi:hypothetical protein
MIKMLSQCDYLVAQNIRFPEQKVRKVEHEMTGWERVGLPEHQRGTGERRGGGRLAPPAAKNQGRKKRARPVGLALV